ncbi:MAG: fructosamine kinase family protein [Gammaproteobacteria bacterium]|nr:fructosamine kinase family protein [Gammaproteobacteria bacterium]MDH5693574.1 fructosamine kinase family protein [Gammaproteobacteria bacterium]
MRSWTTVENLISSSTDQPFKARHVKSVGGGSINDSYLLSSDSFQVFVKVNRRECYDMFAAEAEGLAELAQASAIRVPKIIGYDADRQSAFIAMEYIPMGAGNTNSAIRLGESLAQLHQNTSNRFGWYRDNTIGSTPQINKQNTDWVDFYAENRLKYQYGLALKNGFGSTLSRIEVLLEELHQFFTDYEPAPSLLHGDLWSGNYGYDATANPVLFDPAVYYGDREADIAMTELFGGFSKDFYAAYNDFSPLDNGYRVRKTLYNLYHILNHLNLFGSSYLSQSKNMIDSLCSELV